MTTATQSYRHFTPYLTSDGTSSSSRMTAQTSSPRNAFTYAPVGRETRPTYIRRARRRRTLAARATSAADISVCPVWVQALPAQIALTPLRHSPQHGRPFHD